jgi:uncharacterized protein YciI
MRYVANLSHGPNWLPGRTVHHQGQPIVDHLAAMGRRYDEGSLLLGGPFLDGHHGIAVLEARDRDHATEIMDSDPAVVAGVLVYELDELTAYFDAFAGVRTTESVQELGEQAAARA